MNLFLVGLPESSPSRNTASFFKTCREKRAKADCGAPTYSARLGTILRLRKMASKNDLRPFKHNIFRKEKNIRLIFHEHRKKLLDKGILIS